MPGLMAKLTWPFPKPGGKYLLRPASWESPSETPSAAWKSVGLAWRDHALGSASTASPSVAALWGRGEAHGGAFQGQQPGLRLAPYPCSGFHCPVRRKSQRKKRCGGGRTPGSLPACIRERDAGPARGLLEFADVDSSLPKIAEMLGR